MLGLLALPGEGIAMMGSVVSRSKMGVTPVEKVTELLVKLRDKVQEEGKAEAAGYDKYACFCKEQADGKTYALKKSDERIESLDATVQALAGEIDQLNTDLGLLRGEISTEEDEAKTAKETQEAEFETYQTERQNLTEGVAAITSAVEALRNSRDSMSEVKLAAVFAQLQALSSASFEMDSRQTPKPYEYRSKDILATLQSLLATFKTKLVEVDEEYAADAHQHNMAEGARANQIKVLKASVLKKEELEAKKSAEKSIKEELLSKETAARVADQAFLDELTTACQEKAEAWDQRSQTRAQEITKLTEAMTALEQASSLYSVNKKLTGLVLKGSKKFHAIPKVDGSSTPASKEVKQTNHSRPSRSFLQLGMSQAVVNHGGSAERQRLVDFLEQRAQALKSASLAQVAAFARLAADPFVKVRGLINDLIAKLEAESGEEATQKSFCDTEMSAALTKRDERKAEGEGFQSSIAASTAAIKEHEATIAELSEEIAALHKQLKELAELRNEEKAQNAKTVADADAGKVAVDQAISVLEGFYTGAFMQVRKAGYTPPNADRHGDTVSDLAPETFGNEPYTGKTSASEGVIGLLQVISSDFERTSTNTASAESDAESAYQEQKGSIETSIFDKGEQVSSEGTSKGEEETNLVGFEDGLKSASDLHATSLTELEKLKASCIDGEESYAQRRQRREQEIEGLKEALRILDNFQG